MFGFKELIITFWSVEPKNGWKLGKRGNRQMLQLAAAALLAVKLAYTPMHHGVRIRNRLH